MPRQRGRRRSRGHGPASSPPACPRRPILRERRSGSRRGATAREVTGCRVARRAAASPRHGQCGDPPTRPATIFAADRPADHDPGRHRPPQRRALFVTAGEREEAHLETSLRRLPGVSRTNIVATLSPKGGCGKTTSTFLTGNVLASHLRLRALAVDLNPDFGTLADLAPDRARAPLSLVELLRDKDAIASPGELRPYVSQLPSGLHLLAAPPDPAVMAQMTPELYGELLAFLRRFYEVILLDLGTGVTAPIATFAVDQADQVVVITRSGPPTRRSRWRSDTSASSARRWC
jgi:Mrp family chromosome partitioning ATPase